MRKYIRYMYISLLSIQRVVMLSDEPNNRIGHIEVIDVSFSFVMLREKAVFFVAYERALELFC